MEEERGAEGRGGGCTVPPPERGGLEGGRERAGTHIAFLLLGCTRPRLRHDPVMGAGVGLGLMWGGHPRRGNGDGGGEAQHWARGRGASVAPGEMPGLLLSSGDLGARIWGLVVLWDGARGHPRGFGSPSLGCPLGIAVSRCRGALGRHGGRGPVLL